MWRKLSKSLGGLVSKLQKDPNQPYRSILNHLKITKGWNTHITTEDIQIANGHMRYLLLGKYKSKAHYTPLTLIKFYFRVEKDNEYGPGYWWQVTLEYW